MPQKVPRAAKGTTTRKGPPKKGAKSAGTGKGGKKK